MIAVGPPGPVGERDPNVPDAGMVGITFAPPEPPEPAPSTSAPQLAFTGDPRDDLLASSVPGG